MSILGGIGLMVVFFATGFPRGPEPKAVNRMMDDLRAAKSKMPYEHDGGGLPHLEQYIVDLKRIDLTGVPFPAQDALQKYIEAVENNAQVRRTRGNTNTADVAWKEAEDALGRATVHYRLPPS